MSTTACFHQPSAVDLHGLAARDCVDDLDRLRDLVREETTLRGLLGQPDVVLATGGGSILRESNRACFRHFSRAVWLWAEPTVLTERLGRDTAGMKNRPSLTTAGTLQEVETVLRARLPLYEAVADLRINTTGRKPEQVAERLQGKF